MKKFFNSLAGKIAIVLICPIIVVVMVSIAIVITVNNMSIGTGNEIVATETDAPVYNMDEGLKQAEWITENADDILLRSLNETPKITTEKKVEFTSFSTSSPEADEIFRVVLNNNIGNFISEDGIVSMDYGDASAVELVNALPKYSDFTSLIQYNFETGLTKVQVATRQSTAAAYSGDYNAVMEGISDSIKIAKEALSATGAAYTIGYDEINKLLSFAELSFTFTIDDEAEFTGNLESFGTKSLQAEVVLTIRYAFTYPGITMKTRSLLFSKGDYDTVDITANMSEGISDDEWSLVFISSDESIATVDENGQVTAVANEGTCEITAVLSYLGREYKTKPCTVTVSENR